MLFLATGCLGVLLGAEIFALRWGVAADALGFIAAWTGAAFLWTGIAHVLGKPGMIGKRADGSMAPWLAVPLAPYLAIVWGWWRIFGAGSRELAYNEIVPGLFVGRRVTAGELPPMTRAVLDCTAELFRIRRLPREISYTCVPVLDHESPTPAQLEVFARMEVPQSGALFVHCAQGHGRSAMAAAAMLLRRGECQTVAEAEALLRTRRPGVRLARVQRRMLEANLSRLKAVP
jgi:hypothetical protein